MLTTGRIQKSVLTLSLSGCLYLLSTTSGLAGFEWIPVERTAAPAPQQQMQQPETMVVQDAPVAPVSGEPLQPVQPQAAANSVVAPQPEILVVPSNTAPAPQPIPAQTIAPTPMAATPEPMMPTIMTPSPFDAPQVATPATARVATIPAPQPTPAPIAPAPISPAPIAIQPPAAPAPQIQAATSTQQVIPTPTPAPAAITETTMPVASPAPLSVPPAIRTLPEQSAQDVVNQEIELLESKMVNITPPPAAPSPSPLAIMPTPAPAPVAEALTAAPAQEQNPLSVSKNINAEQAKALAAQQLQQDYTPVENTIAQTQVPAIKQENEPMAIISENNKEIAQENIEELALSPTDENDTAALAEAPAPISTQSMTELPEISKSPAGIDNQPAPSAPPVALVNDTEMPPVFSDKPVPSVDAEAAPAVAMNEPVITNEMSGVYAEAEATQANGQYEVVYGFGKDMPLALAMQQIVPQSYATSFAKSVNPGLRVTWEGDRSWDIVLKEMLEPAGLKATIAGDTVSVVSPADQIGGQQGGAIPTLDVVRPDDFNTKLEPASGVEVDESIDNGISPLEPVSLQIEGDNSSKTKRMIKDPGENPSEQPNLLTPEQLGSLDSTSDITPAEDAANADANTVNAALEEGVLLAEPEIKDEQKISSLSIHQASIDTTSGKTIITPFSKQNTIPPLTQTSTWKAEKGQSLKKVLYTWSQKANIQIVWEASHDYTLENDLSFGGTAEDAIQALFTASKGEEATPTFRFIEGQRNTGKTALVIVQDQPETASNEDTLPANEISAPVMNAENKPS